MTGLELVALAIILYVWWKKSQELKPLPCKGNKCKLDAQERMPELQLCPVHFALAEAAFLKHIIAEVPVLDRRESSPVRMSPGTPGTSQHQG